MGSCSGNQTLIPSIFLSCSMLPTFAESLNYSFCSLLTVVKEKPEEIVQMMTHLLSKMDSVKISKYLGWNGMKIKRKSMLFGSIFAHFVYVARAESLNRGDNAGFQVWSAPSPVQSRTEKLCCFCRLLQRSFILAALIWNHKTALAPNCYSIDRPLAMAHWLCPVIQSAIMHSRLQLLWAK